MKIEVTPLSEITIARYLNLMKVLDFEPAYQREGGVWSEETRSRLIDSIINGLDVPKLYFERVTARRTTVDGRTVQYAVLDGKQRLESIAEFASGQLPLPADFQLYEDESVSAAGFKFADLKRVYPLLAQRVLDYQLPIMEVRSDAIDLIEEMFQRLNASTALNNAERRNAVSGATRDAVNILAEHALLKKKSPVKGSRYKHRELAAKFLAIENQLSTENRLIDTKASTLYDLFLATKGPTPTIDGRTMANYRDQAESVLSRMSARFQDNDALLASVGTLVVYYLVFRQDPVVEKVTHHALERFESLRRDASKMAETAPQYARAANARLREYNVLVQSTNDGRALSRRATILAAFIDGYSSHDELSSLDAVGSASDPTREIASD